MDRDGWGYGSVKLTQPVMANNEGENPFSYKTFVKKKVKPTLENPEANNEMKEMDIRVPQDALFPEVAVLGEIYDVHCDSITHIS